MQYISSHVHTGTTQAFCKVARIIESVGWRKMIGLTAVVVAAGTSAKQDFVTLTEA